MKNIKFALALGCLVGSLIGATNSNDASKSDNGDKSVMPKLIAPAPTKAPAAANVGAKAPNVPSSSNALNQSMMHIQQKALMGLQSIDQQELMQAVASALNAALISDDFEKGMRELTKAVHKLSSVFASKIELSSTSHAQFKATLEDMSNSFNKLVRAGTLGELPGDVYIGQIINELLNGLSAGFKKTKPVAAPASDTNQQSASSSTPAKLVLPAQKESTSPQADASASGKAKNGNNAKKKDVDASAAKSDDNHAKSAQK